MIIKSLLFTLKELVMPYGREKTYLTEAQIEKLTATYGKNMPRVIMTHHKRLYYVAQDLEKLEPDIRARVSACLDLPGLDLPGPDLPLEVQTVPATALVEAPSIESALVPATAIAEELPAPTVSPDVQAESVETLVQASSILDAPTERSLSLESSLDAEPGQLPGEALSDSRAPQEQEGKGQSKPERIDTDKRPPAIAHPDARASEAPSSRRLDSAKRPPDRAKPPLVRDAVPGDSRGNRPLVSAEMRVQPPPVKVQWHSVSATVVGASHLKKSPPVPCQDAALAVGGHRPMVCVADGAGSSILSHLGSDAVVRQLRQLAVSLEPLIGELLDEAAPAPEPVLKRYAEVILRHAVGALQELSQQYRHPLEAFRCTLLVGIAGERQLFWLKVGDGGLVIERESELVSLGLVGKGEYANQTTFLSENITLRDCTYGTVPLDGLTGVAAFTDGAGEKLMSNDGSRIAGRVGKFLADMRAGVFGTHRLFEFLSEPETWKGTTGDDRGMALISRPVP